MGGGGDGLPMLRSFFFQRHLDEIALKQTIQHSWKLSVVPATFCGGGGKSQFLSTFFWQEKSFALFATRDLVSWRAGPSLTVN